MKRIKLFESFVNEAYNPSQAKEMLEEAFPEVSNLEHIGKGQSGHAFIGTIGNDVVVAKLSNSINEFWLTQMAMVSDPPHVVKFRDAKVVDQDRFLYGILHDYVNQDAMPDKKIWDSVSDAFSRTGTDRLDDMYAKLKTNEERHEFDTARKYIGELFDYFGIKNIDTLHQNWGHTEDGELVLYDLDGYVRKGEYEAWMAKHGKKKLPAGLQKVSKDIDRRLA